MVGDGRRSDKNWILALFDTWRPRKATVTATSSSGVAVHVEGEASPRPHLYTSSVSGLPVGTEGVLHPLKGTGSGQFVPVNVPLIPPHNHDNQAPFPITLKFDNGEGEDTTSIDPDNPAWRSSHQVWFPPGVWKYTFTYYARTIVGAGQGQWIVIRIDGTPFQFLHYGDTPIIAASWSVATIDAGSSGRSVWFDGGFCGAWAAGTAWNRGLSIWGTAWKGHS